MGLGFESRRDHLNLTNCGEIFCFTTMQGPTHILTGVIIRRIFAWRDYPLFSISFTVFFGLLSHGILDKVAKATYHPPHADFTDPFWLAYHITVWLISIVMLYKFWGEYTLGIIFAMLPDLDWVILHTADAFGKEIIFYKRPWLHDSLNYILDAVPPFSYLNQLPDNRLLPLACIWEVLLFGILWIFYKALMNRRRNIHF